MNILMMTNTYAPHVGGVARSVEAFAETYRALGHQVLVVAPEFEDMPEHERGVLRVPAIQRFNGSDFSVVLPVSAMLTTYIDDFAPDIVHSHHPYLLGGTALRLSRIRNLPLVFTHHTMYEQYTHYVPGDSPAFKKFVINLSTTYANLCELVFAPSESVRSVLVERGVTTPVEVVPTGVDVKRFTGGNGARARERWGVPRDAFVVGHVGRLAPEKNLAFLAGAVADFLAHNATAHALIVGAGPSDELIHERFAAGDVGDRLHMTGPLSGSALVDAYTAMDVFAFASHSETQGMVLTEAMAAGAPVVALDASGVREVVVDARNGRMLPREAHAPFVDALQWVHDRTPGERARLRQAAQQTAQEFSLETTAATALRHYAHLLDLERAELDDAFEVWSSATRLIKAEWNMLKGLAEKAGQDAGFLER